MKPNPQNLAEGAAFISSFCELAKLDGYKYAMATCNQGVIAVVAVPRTEGVEYYKFHPGVNSPVYDCQRTDVDNIPEVLSKTLNKILNIYSTGTATL